MAVWQTLFKGNYITAAEMGTARPTLTITGTKSVDLEGEDGQPKAKAVVTLKETDRGWVICKTVAQCLGAMFGDEMDGWVGKRVVIYSTEVQVGKEKKPGIRVLGSPDIEKPIELTIRLPRKRPMKLRLLKTPAPKAPSSEPEDAPQDERPPDEAA